MDKSLQGKRITLIRMEDPYTDLKSGDEGTIKFTDGIGQIHVDWDNGSSLAVIPEIDEYEILEGLKHLKMFENFTGGRKPNYSK